MKDAMKKLEDTTTSVEQRLGRLTEQMEGNKLDEKLKKVEDTVDDLDYECRRLVDVLPGITELMKGHV